MLPKFGAWIDGGKVLVDADEIAAWEKDHPQPYKRDSYLGLYAEVHADPVEPHVQQIQHYADDGLSKTGHHGAVAAMGVPRQELPSWDDIQFVTAQLATAAAPRRRAGRHRGRGRPQCAEAADAENSAASSPT